MSFTEYPRITSIFSTPPYALNSFMLSIPVGYSDVALTCLAISFGSSLLELRWHKSNANIQQRIHLNISVWENSISAELIFVNGFQLSDSGEYYCSIDTQVNIVRSAKFLIKAGKSLQDMSPCIVPATNTFQIQVLGTHCNRWNSSKKQQVLVQFRQSISTVLSCEECVTSDDYIRLPNEPTCRHGVVLFRGILADPQLFKNEYCAFSSWHQSGSGIAIDNNIYLVDHNCILSIESLTAPGCHSKMRIDSVAIGSASTSVFLVVVGLVIGIIAAYCRYVCCLLEICWNEGVRLSLAS